METRFIEHPYIKEESLKYRVFQVELSSLCCKENTLILVPTGLGKTAIALLIIAEHLKNHSENKCLILAPTRPLCHQHFKFFKKHLALEEEKIKVVTGEDKLVPRREKWVAKVLCATPQITERDIKRGLLSLDDISLIIFDEAHRAVGKYAYCSLGKKFVGANSKGRIVGMTASIPDDEVRLKEILLNLNIQKIEYRDEHSADVKAYTHKTHVEWAEISIPPILQNIRSKMRSAISSRVRCLQEAGLVKGKKISGISMKKLLELRSEVENKGDFQARADLTSAIRLSHALNLLETQSIKSFLKFFKRLSERSKGLGLSRLLEDQQVKSAYESARGASMLGIEHPKMSELKNLLKSLRRGEKAIVFASYRDSVEDIHESLSADGFRTRYLIGKSGRGQRQNEQVKTIDDMRDGLFDILVATQVGEEGLDISECNLVVFYDNVPSAVRFIQRRGRTGREAPGRVVVFLAKGTKDEAYYWLGRRKIQHSRMVASKLEKSIRDSEGPMDRYVIRKQSSPLVYVDTRESLLLVEELKKLGCRIDVKALPIGDFVVSSDIVIERKTVDDFVKSVIDGRLFNQLVAMREAYPKSVLIVEGDRHKAAGIGQASIFGVFASVVSDFQTSVFMSSGEAETSNMLFHIARREQIEKKKIVRIRSGRKPTSVADTQKYIIAGLPGVSNILAERLLKELRTVGYIFNADESELKRIEGIGGKLARRIREISTKEYESSKE